MAGAQIPDAFNHEPKGISNRMSSKFRNSIPSQHFPAEKGRYVVYVNYCCPWCHRVLIAHALKGLEHIVELVEVDSRTSAHGWWFSGRRGPDRDPVYGVKYIKELYLKADPQYAGRVTLPLLWDKKHETIANNESGDIVRMFLEGFDEHLPPAEREVTKGSASYVPRHILPEIDALNAWVYDHVNNGVYKTGFATNQASYDDHVQKLFQALDRLEYHLSQPGHSPYLFGDRITEADIRLFPTIVRFDVAYYSLFKCNLKMIRYEYPHLHAWLRRLYWSVDPQTAGGVFRSTTSFDEIKRGYSSVVAGNGLIPAGPYPSIMPL
ncbi:transferase [Amniculicola lignicola CBS 123094]|uniref:Transferase n=1 Tax=Amniculicola lignicola CBS 123094 TaxID=1392246 RepID=A0A6A5WRL3_9PLEO|nr:transferase [Amniculicola lignicola CBS 123094]